MYVIDEDKCTACGACASVCPTDAIKEGDVYSITEDCVDCGSCQPECPVDAISEG